MINLLTLWSDFTFIYCIVLCFIYCNIIVFSMLPFIVDSSFTLVTPLLIYQIYTIQYNCTLIIFSMFLDIKTLYIISFEKVNIPDPWAR